MTAPLTVEALMLQAQGAPGAFDKNTPPGTVVSGRITDLAVRQRTDLDGKPQYWDDGNPQQQIVITFQMRPPVGDDDGKARLYIKWYGADKAAALAATHAVGAASFEIGGIITARYDGEGEVTRKGYNAPKLYSYGYEKPNAAAALMSKPLAASVSAPVAPQPPAPLPPAPLPPAANGTAAAAWQNPNPVTSPSADLGHTSIPAVAQQQPPAPAVVDAEDPRIVTIKTLHGHGLSPAEIDKIVPGFGKEAISAVVGLM
jgi:hypothetical protein